MQVHIGHMFFGAGNLGDDLMLAGFLKGIAAAPPGLKLTCTTRYDIDAQRRRFPRIEWSVYSPATRDALTDACDLWLGLGGSILQPLDDHWMLADQVVQLERCRRLGKPAFFLGCSVDYRTDVGRPDIRALLDNAAWIWTREALSTASLRRMGFTRTATGADLAHLALRNLSPTRLEPDSTGFICNFERAEQFSIEALAALIEATAGAGRTVPWLVQEVRPLPGSELELYHRLPAAARALIELRQPDYQTDSTDELVRSWGRPARLFSSRFHGAIIGAWLGSRVVIFERQQKLRGIAADLGIASFAELPAPDQLAQAFERVRPVPQSVLDEAADRAERACAAFLAEATRVVSAASFGDQRSMTALPPPRVERHSLTGVTEVGLDRVAPGLKRGEIFVVRNCLQAIGALAPLRALILDTLEEVAGPVARAEAVARGLGRLHEFIPVDQLMRMTPLMKQRSRRLAAKIVGDLAGSLLGLGPDVHFEDTPNVRIFIPHDVGTRHEAALRAYVQRRGSGGELTLHPPHQDSRHFHPTGAINVWCAIEPVAEANGMSVFPQFYGHHLPFTGEDGGIRPDQYLGPPVTMDLGAGDAWIFETVHVHGSTINQTDRTRCVISFRVTPGVPTYPSKPWYNYVRPADCSADGPPPNPVDYSLGLPDRGPVTIDTSGRLPPVVAAQVSANGAIVIPSGMLPEGEIRPVSDDLCIARIDGKPIAFFRGCPHEGADLAGGAVRNGQIMCHRHGLRMNASDGRSACRSLGALELVACAERDGLIIIAPAAGEEEPAEISPPREHGAEIEHFIAAADQFTSLLEAYRPIPDDRQLEQLRPTRDAAIYALLALPGTLIRTRLELPVSRLITGILESRVRHLPRTAEEEATFAECCRRLDRSWAEDAGFVYGLAALALSWHGYELVALRPLDQDLGWAEPFWLKALLGSPPPFLRPGDADRFADTLAPLMAQVLDRFERTTVQERLPLMTAFLASDLYVQGYFNEKNMCAAMLARGRVIERLMTLEGARLDQLVVRRPTRRRPRIGFIAISVQDRTESVFLLAHMEHLARQGFDVRLYTRMDPEGGIGALCRNAAETFIRLPNSIIASTTLLRSEDLDIAVFATNLSASPNAVVMFAAQRIARIQATATWTPMPSGLRNIDVMISGEYGEIPGAEAHYTERLVRMPGAHTCFPFQHMLQAQIATTTVSRAELGIPDTAPIYISAASSYKILPELSRCWIDILAQVPEAYLILLPFNPNWSKRFDPQPLLRRIVGQMREAGLGNNRVRVLPAQPSIADLHKVLGVADIYLDSFPYSGACSIWDPVAVGLPIVARAGQTCRSRQSYAMLREIGLDDWVTFSESQYIDRAVRLGRDPVCLEAAAARLAEVTADGQPFADTVRYAAKLAACLSDIIADWDRRTARLQALPETARADRIAALVPAFGTTRSGFSNFDLLEEVVVPYLRHTGKRRFIHVGTGFDAVGGTLIEDGWQGILFGPDGTPAGRAGTATAEVASIPGKGIAAHIELGNFNGADLVWIDAGGNDFTILADLNFGAIAPKLVLASFDPNLPAQNAATIGRILEGMRVNGYRAALFGFAAVAGAGRAGLSTIAIDRLPAEPRAGSILFFRAVDDSFLPSLLGWLEDVVGAAADGSGADGPGGGSPGDPSATPSDNSIFALPYDFVVPESTKVGGASLRALVEAVARDDRIALADLRTRFAPDSEPFDCFVAAVRQLGTGDAAGASREFARLGSTEWRLSASVLRSVALAETGELRQAIALRNRVSDFVRAAGLDDAPDYPGDAALLREGVRCLRSAEADLPVPDRKPQIGPPFRYVIAYPRSGSTFLLQFLTHAFGTPHYSVYPAVARYFSSRFHEAEPGRAVFVKDHVLRPEYLEDEILAPMRDGRNCTVSLARYLYAEGGNRFVRRGELADFISFVAARMPYGSWAAHTRALLEARDRGARVRLVRYEETFGSYSGLLALARELAGGAGVPNEDEAGYQAFVASEKRRMSRRPEWSEGIALPEDSFIPPNWSVGGATSDWCRIFDAPARRRFHDLGGTEMLIRLGYETDEDWWRQG
jgi:predicted O-linked N-acetylglucosamine transferase (SPINDLY family)/polysaccharide pyruvyl transferase WcaK-like protein/nitrite reductase/ring-hydroxylating ferredoxin subunit